MTDTELVERLRNHRCTQFINNEFWPGSLGGESDAKQAADLITRQAAEIERLRKASVTAVLPLEALNIVGLDKFAPELRDGILAGINTVRTALQETGDGLG